MSLAEVLDDAKLQTRVDRKYIVPLELMEELFVLLNMDVLEIDARRQFNYESVYFDTAEWASFRSAAYSRRDRFKLRTRTYLDSGLCMLELKLKSGRDETVKDRIGYEVADAHRVNERALAFLSERLLLANGADLRPVLTTLYQRVTLVDREAGGRVTCDTALSCVGDDESVEVSMPGHAIVETKSTNHVGTADRVLWSVGIRPMSVSKYCVGIASLYPDLPRNKWHRVISRYVTVGASDQ